MALFQPHINLYMFIKNKILEGKLNNTLKLFYSEEFSTIEKPPQFVCPDFVPSQVYANINIEQLLENAGKDYSDIFLWSNSLCSCKQNEILIYNRVELYLNLIGGNKFFSEIVWSDELSLYVIKVVLNVGTSSIYINGFETGYSEGQSYTPYFWHITPLICITLGTNIYLKLDYVFALPPSCE